MSKCHGSLIEFTLKPHQLSWWGFFVRAIKVRPNSVGAVMKLWAGVLLLAVAMSAAAECRDRDAMAASDDLAQRLMLKDEIFNTAKVLKVHHPTKRKEIASYIKAGQRYYSIFTLVDEDCNAVFRKRTRWYD
jgi:hypothetical protein